MCSCPDGTTLKEVGLTHYWLGADEERQDIRTRQDILDCYDLHMMRDEGYDSEGDASSAHSVPGRGVNDNEQKRCMISGECPYLVKEDFYEDNVNSCRELFLCDSCHQGYHYECVLQMGSEDECDSMLDVNAVW